MVEFEAVSIVFFVRLSPTLSYYIKIGKFYHNELKLLKGVEKNKKNTMF